LEKKYKKTVTFGIFLIIALSISSVSFDFYTNNTIKIVSSQPSSKIDTKENLLLWQLANSQPVNPSDIQNIRKYVDGRYDCSDFRLPSILRIIYEYPDRLSNDIKQQIREMLLGFKYWMDEPGEDGMCYWSENHQILFAAGEYLAGQMYPEDIFVNDGLTGKEHREKARQRILIWLSQRWRYGLTEWYSNVYYLEEITHFTILIDFYRDKEIVNKSKMIFDLLLYDIASQSFKGTFVTSSGRAYEHNKKAGINASTRAISEFLLGYDSDPAERKGMDLNFFLLKNYQVPEIIKEIGRDENIVEIKASNGLNVAELHSKGLIGTENQQIMIQWAMEAFTNSEIITNSVKYIDQNNLYSNEFLAGFISVNYTLLKRLPLLPLISKILNPQTNGIAIQRANTYTYKTPFYSMYTTQSYHPGSYGDQHHIFGVTLSNELSIFHNHPAIFPGEKVPFSNSPSYWVGYGHLPHSAQDKNINLSLYILPASKALLEKRLIDYTHLYCPRQKFDKFILEKNYVFLQYKNTFIAFIGKNPLIYYEKEQEIIQQGKTTYWICEISQTEQESFEDFQKRIRSNSIQFHNKTLRYTSGGKNLSLTFQGDFVVDGKIIDTQYKRFESPYIKAEREPQEMRFTFKDNMLYLNFEKNIRITN
jgi:hypothetical protein